MECSTQAINQYKLGASLPTIANLIKIAEYYNVSTDYLLGLSDIRVNTGDNQALVEEMQRIYNAGMRDMAKAIIKRYEGGNHDA